MYKSAYRPSQLGLPKIFYPSNAPEPNTSGELQMHSEPAAVFIYPGVFLTLVGLCDVTHQYSLLICEL